jgi:hypothetical protein
MTQTGSIEGINKGLFLGERLSPRKSQRESSREKQILRFAQDDNAKE